MAGIKLYHCKQCNARVPFADISAGLAHVISEQDGIALCSECVRTPAGSSGPNPVRGSGPKPVKGSGPIPVKGIPVDDVSDTKQAAPVDIVPPAATRARQSSRHGLQPAAPVPTSPLTSMIALIAGAAMVVVAGLIFLIQHRAHESKTAEHSPAGNTPVWPENMKSNSSTSTRTATGTATDTKKSDAPEDAKDPTPEFNSMPANETTLLKLSADEFKGGKAMDNLSGRGRTARSIYGTKTKDPSMSASFELRKSPDGPAALIVDSIRHGAGDPCHISISVNGHEIFQGADPDAAAAADEWIQHRFPVDARILHADRNEIRFNNLETSAADGPPSYTISAVEIRVK
jgi:hypothetical protein